MKSRIIVAIIGIPLLIVVLCVLPAAAAAVLMAAVCCIGCFEIYRMAGLTERKDSMILCMVSACAVQLLCLLRGYEAALWAVFPFMTLLFLLWVLDYEHERKFGIDGLAVSVFSAVLVPLGLAALTMIRKGGNGNLLVLAPLVVTMTGDSGALFVGKALGKKKLSPRTSPHKTVAGLVGGLICSAVFLPVFGLVMRLFGVALNIPMLIPVGLLCGCCGQLGDLAFSVIKRQYGAKDYGNLLPGHGGAYDRFDSLTLAAPCMLILLRLAV